MPADVLAQDQSKLARRDCSCPNVANGKNKRLKRKAHWQIYEPFINSHASQRTGRAVISTRPVPRALPLFLGTHFPAARRKLLTAANIAPLLSSCAPQRYDFFATESRASCKRPKAESGMTLDPKLAVLFISRGLASDIMP